MTVPPGVALAKMTSVPLFDLATIGGPTALRRWIAIADRHPRAVAPVVNIYRQGEPAPSLALLEAAAGIEYWVKSHRPAAWTSQKGFATALSRRVGRAFATWTGDPDSWAKLFWDANNKLKHEPTYAPDPTELMDLAVSGRYLLAAAILDQVARSKSASRAIFASHRLVRLGHRLRAHLGADVASRRL